MGNFALQVLHIAFAATWVVLLFAPLRALGADERSGTAAARQRRRMVALTLPAAIGALATGAVLLAREPRSLLRERVVGLVVEVLAAAALAAITLHAGRSLGALAHGDQVPSRRHFRVLEEIFVLLIALTLLISVLQAL